MKKMSRLISKKALIMMLAGTVAVGGAVGTTVAWLADTAVFDSVTFTDSTLKISVSDDTVTSEDDLVKKMIPGRAVDKAPLVTVSAGSEDCYLFIKIDEDMEEITTTDINGDPVTYSFDDYISYNIIMAENENSAMGWHQLTDENGYLIENVYYRVVRASKNYDQSFYILDCGSYEFGGEKYEFTTDQILVNPDVTVEMMDALGGGNYPELSVTAYAIQYYKSNETPFAAYEAWANISF